MGGSLQTLTLFWFGLCSKITKGPDRFGSDRGERSANKKRPEWEHKGSFFGRFYSILDSVSGILTPALQSNYRLGWPHNSFPTEEAQPWNMKKQ